jgi:hypothetical protein
MHPAVAAVLAAASLGSVPRLDTVVEARYELEGDWAWQMTFEDGGCGNCLPRMRGGPQPDLRIRGHTMKGYAETEWDATFRYVPPATSKGIDIVFVDQAGRRVLRRGYYRLVGRDRLRICLAEPDQARTEAREVHIFTRAQRRRDGQGGGP